MIGPLARGDRGRSGGRDIRIGNSRVMGASAVNVVSTATMLAGLTQFAGHGSYLVTRFGGSALDYTWSGCLILAWALVMLARWREQIDPVDAAWLEVGGVLLLATVLGVFDGVLIKGGLEGQVFVAAICTSSIINLCARALMLITRVLWVRKAASR